MQGPDPSEAGPSRVTNATTTPHAGQPTRSNLSQNFTVAPHAMDYPFYNYSPQSWAQNTQWQAYSPQNPTNYPQYSMKHPPIVPQLAQGYAPPSQTLTEENSIPRSTSPQPTPPFRKHWDDVLKRFMEAAGLSQALRGFQSDMLVMSSECERGKVSIALATLREDLVRLDTVEEQPPPPAENSSLEERKLHHAHFAKNVEPQTPSTITKSISRFIAQNRARNDASNRNEFLLSLAEKKKKLQEAGSDNTGDPGPSCARTDAKTQNRDVQMKYDIVKNEDGPLRKTLKRHHDVNMTETKAETTTMKSDDGTASRYPGLDERLSNIETHVAVRYVPSPPRLLLDRVKLLEDHLVRLEKEYPPWAALHFNQPLRGWPPPPRPTPIIVPSHLTAMSEPLHANTQVSTPHNYAASPGVSEASAPKAKSKATGRSTMSTLQRAVMDRLEVQKAMNDLEGVKTEPEA